MASLQLSRHTKSCLSWGKKVSFLFTKCKQKETIYQAKKTFFLLQTCPRPVHQEMFSGSFIITSIKFSRMQLLLHIGSISIFLSNQKIQFIPHKTDMPTTYQAKKGFRKKINCRYVWIKKNVLCIIYFYVQLRMQLLMHLRWPKEWLFSLSNRKTQLIPPKWILANFVQNYQISI